MRELRRKYKRSEKKYDAVVDRVEEAVDAAIAAATWTSGAGTGEERPLREHPFFSLVDGLSAEAKEQAAKRKNPDETVAKLTKYPWNSQLELLLGLEYGADRAVPDHERGFIDLGTAPMPPPGFPDVVINQYLYGLGEIVGWQYRVKSGKRAKYEGRKPKDRPTMASAPPSWERLRIYLLGSVPEVSLYAIPQLTHRIHSRSAERRLEGSGDRPHMDEFLTLLDSKWNGFVFDVPHTKNRTAFALPAHALFTEDGGFVLEFAPGQRLAHAGDIPFIAIQTYEQYAKLYRDERIGPHEFIVDTPEAKAVRQQFTKESTYLAKYKRLIDLIVRAILAPDLRYPTYLANYDYPDGKIPEVREVDDDLDMPRRHALMVWAYVGKDPEALADFVYDQILSKQANRFPNDVSLPVQFTLRVREMEGEMMKAIAARIVQERGSPAVGSGDGHTVGDYEREFSPHAAYRDARGEPTSAYLAHSFHTFHRSSAEVIREAAHAVVTGELED